MMGVAVLQLNFIQKQATDRIWSICLGGWPLNQTKLSKQGFSLVFYGDSIQDMNNYQSIFLMYTKKAEEKSTIILILKNDWMS